MRVEHSHLPKVESAAKTLLDLSGTEATELRFREKDGGGVGPHKSLL